MAQAKHAAPEVTKEEIEKHKTMAILAWIVFFIPLLTDAKDSKFAKFHANQSLVLNLALIVGYILSSVLMAVLIGFLLWGVVAIGGLVFWIMGIMSASKGEMKRLPLIGNIDIIK